MKKWLFALIPLLGSALEVQPWFGDCLEFHFLGSYAYSYFDKVQKGTPQLTSTFQSNVVSLGLDFSPTPEWSVDGDFQVADTTQENFNFRSIALQARYLWLDDIIGDKISLATGGNARFTNTDSLHDVSCPSHANFDFEFNVSLGKEFDASDAWAWRLWGFGAVGHGNRGSPWVRGIVAIETNYDDQHKLAFFAEGSNGYGRHTTVLINDFNGYAKIRQKSIDIGARYGYRIGVWGTLRFEYMRRVLAKSCPQEVNSFIFSYLLPFSF
ncbi:MAG: hypothetical protein COT85_03190 [Chlamydiae bacterium CG10_big_fil_rev_8_21_14_0_10_42_34]|nr:MAG: hypothetical protein COT85_03190 [Chlamydiae bacterium CG10_big_fil_rev_8_21_14_0_10_42_34]